MVLENGIQIDYDTVLFSLYELIELNIGNYTK